MEVSVRAVMEVEPDFLCFDHINDDGGEHRQTLGGKRIHQWLKANNWPEGLVQVLCYNCNAAKSRPGGCPHQRKQAS